MTGPLFIVGMMGAGKSTIGALLAEKLGVPFIDTDAEIERLAGKSIPEIFADEGESGFRGREQAVLEGLSGSPAVISLGGGAIAQAGVAERCEALGDLIYLEVSAEVILKRIGNSRGRPMLADLSEEGRLERIMGLFSERRSYYEQARYRVDAESNPDQVVSRILGALKSAPISSMQPGNR